MHESFTEYDPIAALEAMAAQRTAEARGGDLRVDSLLPPSPEVAKDKGVTEIDMYEATEYYRTDRGAVRGTLTQHYLFSRQATGLGWDAFNRAEVLLTQPMCIVVGDKPGAFGAYWDGFEIVRRAASTDKDLVIVEGYSHYDLYDKPEPVKQALARFVPFYKKHL